MPVKRWYAIQASNSQPVSEASSCMNYQRIYSEFIADRLTKQPVKPDYFEKHHIFPRSLGGGDEKSNIIRLTPEDHLFAHLLLAKVHGGGMWHAVCAMLMTSHKRPQSERYVFISRRVYAKARVEAASAHSMLMKGRFTGEDHPMWGVPCSELSKQKTRERHAAGFNPMATKEAREKVSKALKGRIKTESHCLKISLAKTGVKDSDETRRRKSAGHKGLVKSGEAREKLSASLKGRKLSESHVENMRSALTGRKLSNAHVEKIRQAYFSREVRFGFGGKSHNEDTRARMSAVNVAKKVYAAKFGVSPKYVNIQMIISAGIEIGNS